MKLLHAFKFQKNFILEVLSEKKESSYVIINTQQMIWDVFLGNILLKEE